MKNRFFATFSSLTLLTAAAAFGQSNTVMQADIPFKFRVGETVLPAGRYDVRPQAVPGVTSLRCFKCNAGAVILTDAVSAVKTPEAGKLVFNRYGDTYFLSKVWTPGYPQGRQLRKSSAEIESARSSPRTPPATVALAVR